MNKVWVQKSNVLRCDSSSCAAPESEDVCELALEVKDKLHIEIGNSGLLESILYKPCTLRSTTTNHRSPIRENFCSLVNSGIPKNNADKLFPMRDFTPNYTGTISRDLSSLVVKKEKEVVSPKVANGGVLISKKSGLNFPGAIAEENRSLSPESISRIYTVRAVWLKLRELVRVVSMN